MTDYFRGKTLICEQTKPRAYFTPVFQRIGDRLKLHHMEVDCLGYRQPKKMLPIEHMGKHKRRIFELEDENAKLRQMVWVMRDCLADECKRCSEYGFPCEIDHDMQELGIGICDLATDGELGIEVVE